ncbi:MAG: DASS family sodium-coupled anion symporter [Candidatus Eisenbacteria bacterium]|nr:DASS family sodium-coupled anion symporter [Candidatus Eisenbacteria bacterium]
MDEEKRSERKDPRPMGGFYGFLWDSSWNAVVLQLCVLTLLIVAVLPAPAGLSTAGLRALGIFVVSIALWITQALPPAITGLLALALLPLFGVLPSADSFALFGNSSVFFILGVFILAAAIMRTGLSRRVAIWLLARLGHNPALLLFGVFLLGWTFALTMSEHAVAAALLPVVLELVRVAEKAGGEEAQRYGKGLLLSLAWGTIIGGTGTMLGGARAPLAAAILKKTTGEEITFFDYTLAVAPVTLALLPVGYLLLYLLWGRRATGMRELRASLLEQVRTVGPFSAEERGVAIVFVATVFAWVFLGKENDLATIAILSAVALFVFRLVSWRDTEEYVNWGILLMYGGAVALGTALSKSGAAAWAAQHILGDAANNPLLLIVLLGLLASILTEAMSNAAVVALLLPVGISLADATGMNGAPVALIIALASGLDYCLPTGAPPVAIVFSSGRLDTKDVVYPGLILLGFTWALTYLTVRFYWPMIGLMP